VENLRLKTISLNINAELINILLASGIVSVFTSYFVSIRLKKQDFKNDYYKEIIKRRCDAYNEVDIFVSQIKVVVVDEKNGETYHSILSRTSHKFLESQVNLQQAMLRSFWIDEKKSSKLEDINYLFFNIILEIYNKNSTELIMVAKKYYKEISDLRIA
tara:strand:- start:8647 stop:9123 length:477 start_codon:yes stop_codon:yes gene_type:complete